MKNKTKCLFIYVTDGSNDRFLVKSDLLDRLKERVDNIYIFFNDGDNASYKKQFEAKNVFAIPPAITK